jgi:enoyl-CoA hydratase/carnithine racemase
VADVSDHVNRQPNDTATGEGNTLLVERRDAIAEVRLNRPGTLNALTADMGPAYAALLADLDADPAVRGILVTGEGRGFCSGADLTTLGGSVEDLRAYVSGQSIATLPAVAMRLGTPVATAINGPCAGIGFVLAVSADARFVHPEATLSTTFARLGLVAEYGIAWLLPRIIGRPAATDLLLTGRTITGVQADEMGLAIASTDPVAAAREWLTTITTNASPASVATMKRQLLEAEDQTLEQSIAASLVDMAAAFDSPDLAEALAARADKRAPNFANYPAPR